MAGEKIKVNEIMGDLFLNHKEHFWEGHCIVNAKTLLVYPSDLEAAIMADFKYISNFVRYFKVCFCKRVDDKCKHSNEKTQIML